MATAEGKVAHVWRRLGFGPRPGDVAAGVAAGGPTAVIEDLLSRPAGAPIAWPASTGWWAGVDETASAQIGAMCASRSQLHERVAWILQGVIVAALQFPSVRDLQEHMDVLRSWKQTSYRNLLDQAVRGNAVQHYLTNVWSTPPHPNENLARELMELFSLGVTHPRSGAANYTENDVKEIARALTGYGYDWNTQQVSWNSGGWDAGTKTFLGQSRGQASMTEVIDAVASHPSFRYFLPRRLFRELVGLEPGAARLDQLASAWGSTGDISAVVSAIARSPEFLSDAAIRARVKSPLEMAVGAARIAAVGDVTRLGGIPHALNVMGQHPLLPPNVAGWPTGRAWLHAGVVTTWVWPLGWLLFSDDGTDQVDPAFRSATVRRLHAEASSATGGDLALSLAGLHDVSPQTRSAVRDFAAAGAWNHNRAATTLSLVLQSPEFYVN